MEIGSIVYLKSGSPPMTVFSYEEPLITTVWFVGSIRSSAQFDVNTLTLDDPTVAIDHARRKLAAQQEINDPIPVKEIKAAEGLDPDGPVGVMDPLGR